MRYFILLLALLPIGCASTVLDQYDHEQSYHCRIDNPDQDNLWDTSDENGNGLIDDGEIAGPVFDFAKLAGEFSGRDLSGGSNATSQSSYTYGYVNVTTDLSLELQRIPLAGSQGNRSFEGAYFPLLGEYNGDGIYIPAYDFGDLHSFNIFFDRILTAPHTETHGMQVASRHRFSAKEAEPAEAKQSVELSYGARYLRLTENFMFEGMGSSLGRTVIDMEYDNRLVGPQVALEWNRSRRGWNLSAGSTLMLGYNLAQADQHAIVGQDLLPGGLNSSASGRPMIVETKREHEELAAIAEVNALATYPLRDNLDFHVGYRALYISELRHAGESISFELPSLGILDNGSNGAWLEGLHASVEWRR